MQIEQDVIDRVCRMLADLAVRVHKLEGTTVDYFATMPTPTLEQVLTRIAVLSQREDEIYAEKRALDELRYRLMRQRASERAREKRRQKKPAL